MSPVSEILVADDDEHDLAMICAAFQKAGGARLRVNCVHDGAEALDFLYGRGGFASRELAPPAFLLLDLHMPRVNGWEVLRQVKEDASLSAIPVVIFSSSARDADVRRCYDLGANAYVVKPIDFGEFESVIGATEAFWVRCNHRPEPKAAPPAERPEPPRRRRPAAAPKKEPT